jgi:hypothetical protein
MTQIKIPADIKREIEIFSTLTDRTQSELVADAWREYRARHNSEFREGLRRAEEILADPEATAVSASGMSRPEIDKLDQAFNEEIAEQSEAEPTASSRSRKRKT